MDNFDIAVLGGGASGFMSAISAKNCNNHLKIVILEKSERVLKKLSATGNGQGNFSNSDLNLEHYFNNQFCGFALENFDFEKTADFFKKLGIEPISIENRIYPKSLQASSLTDALMLEADRLKIESKLNFNITDLKLLNGQFIINENITAKKIIVCLGGKASPQFGTDGNGYELMLKFNHKIIPPKPSLVQIKTENTFTKMLQGIKVNALAKLIVDDNIIKLLSGEVLFCDYGLSGKAVFELSPYISWHLNNNSKILLSLDLLENLRENEFFELLTIRKDLLEYRTAENFLTGLINKQLAKVIFKTLNINLSMPVKNLSEKNLKDLAEKLKNFEFKVLDTLGFKTAQVTIGGIDTNDVDNKTLMSKIVNNLYFAGEILDVDGECGGYNLQWAWSSGYLAGKSAANL